MRILNVEKQVDVATAQHVTGQMRQAVACAILDNSSSPATKSKLVLEAGAMIAAQRR
jgi:hypothetical protein